MLAAFETANERIGEENERRHGKPDEMGTTLVALHLRQDRLQWVSVGDSPLYLFRKDELLRLNKEHAAPMEVNGAPPRSMLTSALTGSKIRIIDAPPRAVILEPGDIIVCASDGIHSCEHDRLCAQIETLADLPAGALAEALIAKVEGARLANQDNVTVAVIKYQPVAAVAAAAPPAAHPDYASRPS
jgi:protein phosphatase